MQSQTKRRQQKIISKRAAITRMQCIVRKLCRYGSMSGSLQSHGTVWSAYVHRYSPSVGRWKSSIPLDCLHLCSKKLEYVSAINKNDRNPILGSTGSMALGSVTGTHTFPSMSGPTLSLNNSNPQRWVASSATPGPVRHYRDKPDTHEMPYMKHWQLSVGIAGITSKSTNTNGGTQSTSTFLHAV